MKKYRGRIIQAIISLGILSLLIYHLDFSGFGDVELQITPLSVAILLGALMVSLWLRSERWRYLMVNSAGSKVKIGHADSFKFMLVGQALNTVLPAGSGDVARAYFGYRWTGVKEKMLAVSLFDKIIAIGSLFFLGFYSYLTTQNIWFLLATAACIGPLIALLFAHQLRRVGLFNRMYLWVNRKVKKIDFDEVLESFKFNAANVGYVLLLSIVGWGFSYVLLYMCMETVGLDISIYTALGLGPLLTLGRLFPFTLNGLGTDEAILVLLFRPYTDSDELLLVAALVYRLVLLIIPAVLGLYFLSVTKNMKAEQEA